MPTTFTPEQLVEQIEQLDPEGRRKLAALLSGRETISHEVAGEPMAAYTVTPRAGAVSRQLVGTDIGLIEDEEERIWKYEKEFHAVFPDMPISRELLSMVGVCRFPAEADEDFKDDARLIEEAIFSRYLIEPTG